MTTKSQSYPETVPASYAVHPDTDRAYRMGWNHGHGIACHNVPTLGDRIDRSVDYVGCGREVTAENIREYHELLCFAAESNSRQYSPFEFTAHEFNRADDAELTVHEITGEGEFQVLNDEGDCLESGFTTREAAQAWIDALPDSEALWEAFDAGIGDAIRADLATYTDDDYGIESEDAGDIREDEDTSRDPFPHTSERETQA